MRMKNLVNKAAVAATNVAGNVKAKIGAVAMVVTGASMTALCATSLEDSVNLFSKLIFGFLGVLGVFQIVQGILAIKSIISSDDHGGDQNSTSKAVGKIVAGILTFVGPFVVLKALGIADPMNLGTHWFQGL